MFKITHFSVLKFSSILQGVHAFSHVFYLYLPSGAAGSLVGFTILCRLGGQPTLHQNPGNHLGGNPAQGDALVEWSELTTLSL